MSEQTTKIDERMESVAEIARHIKPNPKCRVSGCNGTRGYFAIQIGKDGLPQIMLCCGEIGLSEYAQIAKQLGAMNQSINMLFEMNRVGHAAVFNHTFWGAIAHAWAMLTTKLKIRKGPK